MTTPAPIVLVHGAWYGSWCWTRVVAALEDRGHRVIAVDLPGRPANPVPFPEVSLELWVEHVRSTVEAAGEPVVLAGHSLGGAVVTGAAESVPDLVSATVYITAFLLRDGEAPVEVVRRDSGSEMAAARILASDGLSSRVDPRRVADVLCGGCDAEDIAWVARSLSAEATAVARTPVRWTGERFGRVRRHYVECTLDRVVSIEAQRAMHRATRCDRVFTLETGHAPFFSEPERLVSILADLADPAADALMA